MNICISTYGILIHHKTNLVDNHMYNHCSKLGNYMFLNQINNTKDKYKYIYFLPGIIVQMKFNVSLQ